MNEYFSWQVFLKPNKKNINMYLTITTYYIHNIYQAYVKIDVVLADDLI